MRHKEQKWCLQRKPSNLFNLFSPWISSATTLTTGKPFHRSMLLLTWMQQIQGRLIFIRMGPDLGPWIDLLLLRQWTKMQLSVADKWNHHMLSSLRGFSFPFEAVGEEGVASGQGADETSRFQRPNSSRGQAAFLIWRYHAQQVLLQCCPFASQSRWVLITGEEPWPLASQAPATKCLLRTVALGPTPQPALTWSLLYPPQALRMLQSHSSQGARSWRPKRKSFYSVLRKWITMQCTGIAKIRLIYYSTGRDTINRGDVPEGYDVSRDELEHFPLTLKSASPNQTSVYFCASSESTAWHGCFLPAQKERQTEVLKIPDPN